MKGQQINWKQLRNYGVIAGGSIIALNTGMAIFQGIAKRKIPAPMTVVTLFVGIAAATAAFDLERQRTA